MAHGSVTVIAVGGLAPIANLLLDLGDDLIQIQGFIGVDVFPQSHRVADSTLEGRRILGGDGPNLWKYI